jgi:selenocysteine lyase/cysteine desulfurase
MPDGSVKGIFQQNSTTCIVTPFGPRFLINADSTASGFPHRQVEKFLENNVLPYYSNTHSNALPGQIMSHYIKIAKREIRRQCNASEEDVLLFTGNGCTGAINHLIHLLGLSKLPPEKLAVITSISEHHSNYLPWVELGAQLELIGIDGDGLLDTDQLEALLKEISPGKAVYVTLSAASNVTGVIQRVGRVNQLVHRYGGRIFWDYAASAPYVDIDLRPNPDGMDYADAIFLSPHKFLGGPGSPGLLIVNKRLVKTSKPFNPGGGTVRFVCSRYRVYIEDYESRETGGTPNIIGCIRAGLAFVLKRRLFPLIERRDRELTGYVQSELLKIEQLDLLNPIGNSDRLPIFAFVVPRLHYNYVVTLLSDLFGIATRGGVSCCSLLAQDLLKCDRATQDRLKRLIVGGRGIPDYYGWCRVSFHYTMPNYVVDYIVAAIGWIARHGHLLLDQYKYNPQTNCWSFSGRGGIRLYQKLSEDRFDAIDTRKFPSPKGRLSAKTLDLILKEIQVLTEELEKKDQKYIYKL